MRYYLKTTSYKVCVHKSILLDYKHLDVWIRQEYIRLEADRVYNGEVSRNR